VRADERDMTELLQHLLYYFPNLKQPHVRDVYWGVRPLLHQKGSTPAASREHRLVKSTPSFWSFPGVKLTAARAAGEEAAFEAWGFIRRSAPRPEVTWDPLPGGDLTDFDNYVRFAQKRFNLGIQSDAMVAYLVSMYGTRFVELVQWSLREPHYINPILPGEPWILAQAAYAVHEEMVLTLNDFLWRRTKWAHWRDLPDTAVRKIAETLGFHLQWSSVEVQKQMMEYNKELKKHRLS